MNEVDIVSPAVRGLRYPLTVVNGNLATSEAFDTVTQQIRSVLETRYYERVMRADYGIGDFVLEIVDPSQINSSIQFSILEFVDGITELQVEGDWTNVEDGTYRVIIEYALEGQPQAPLEFVLAN